MGWTRQAVGQQHNNNTPATYVLEVRRAVAQLLLVNRAGRELLHRERETTQAIAQHQKKRDLCRLYRDPIQGSI